MLWAKPLLVEVERNWIRMCAPVQMCVCWWGWGWSGDGQVFLECRMVEDVRNININEFVNCMQGHG